MTKLRIALVQMFSEKGDIEKNLAETARHIEEADKRGVDIIGFPEASITGFHEPARFPHAVLRQDSPEVTQFVKMTEGRNLTALAGIIEENPDGVPFTTHIVARKGNLTGYYRKMSPPVGEGEWYAPGKENKVFCHGDTKYGIAICADIKLRQNFKECSQMEAKIMFELAAPGLYGDRDTRDWKAGYEWWEDVCLRMLSDYAMENNLWIAVASQAGRTSDEDFPGGGFLFSPKGERVYATKDWQPGVAYLEIDFDSGTIKEIT